MRASKLEEMLAPEVNALGFELYGCEMGVRFGDTVLVLYIDSPSGVTIDDCSVVSRQVTGILDVADPIAGRYQLEVSSPGLDRPLFKRSHYERVLGKTVKFKLRYPQEGRRQGEALLKQVVDETVTLVLKEGGELAVSIADIEKARLVADI